MKNNDDEAAFPHIETGEKSMRVGMTLRDYFAAKAMNEFTWDGNAEESLADAKRCYAVADAMLEARK